MMQGAEHETTTRHDDAVAMGVHIVPWPVLVAVWAGLLALTVVTVAVTYVDLGVLNLWVAMAIAVVKAALVGLYFMHLRYDHPLHAIVLIAALLFIVLFISLAMMDTAAYYPDVLRYELDMVAGSGG